MSEGARQYTDSLAQYVEERFDHAAEATRKILQADWMPEAMKKIPPPPPVSRVARPAGEHALAIQNFVLIQAVPASYLEQAQSWVSKHKFLTAVLVLVVSGATYKIIKYNTPRKRRRAARCPLTNARKEVVILAASPAEMITRSIAFDLERRGFIVYIVCANAQDELMVKRESRTDVRPLMVTTSDVCQKARNACDY